jgi:hypothetical protein
MRIDALLELSRCQRQAMLDVRAKLHSQNQGAPMPLPASTAPLPRDAATTEPSMSAVES